MPKLLIKKTRSSVHSVDTGPPYTSMIKALKAGFIFVKIYSAAALGSSEAAAAGASAAAVVLSSLAGASVWPAAPEVSASDEVQRVCQLSAVLLCCHSGRKTYQVVAQELHDESRVLVALLAKGVELCGIASENGDKRPDYMMSLPAMASSNACLARWQA